MDKEGRHHIIAHIPEVIHNTLNSLTNDGGEAIRNT
jgi:hypothetical protein